VNFKSIKYDISVITRQNSNLYIGNSKIHGRGVFSNLEIKPESIIETCPVIKMKLEELVFRKSLVLNYYPFLIDERKGYGGIVLGYGSLYNHSKNFNTIYYYDPKRKVMIYEALCKIKSDEEITINYLKAGSSDKEISTWFNKNIKF